MEVPPARWGYAEAFGGVADVARRARQQLHASLPASSAAKLAPLLGVMTSSPHQLTMFAGTVAAPSRRSS